MLSPVLDRVLLRKTQNSFDFRSGTVSQNLLFTRLGQTDIGVDLGNKGEIATYFDSSGILQQRPIHLPRIDYDSVTLALKGLLIEPAATNLAIQSNMAGGTWGAGTNCTKTANAGVAPDGTTTAPSFVPNNAAAATLLTQASFTVVNGTTYIESMRVKPKGGQQWVYILAFDASSSNAWFDLVNGVVGSKDAGISASSITAEANGWFRIQITRTVNSTTLYLSLRTASADNSTASVTGDGVKGVYATEAEVKVGSDFSDSYVPTPNSPSQSKLRSADAASFFIAPGGGALRYTFDDNSTEDVSVSAGFYTIPTNLRRRWIKTITGPIARPTHKIIFHGDSIINGFLAGTPFWSTTLQNIFANGGIVAANKIRGVNGQGFNYVFTGTDSLIAEAATQVDAARDGSLINKLVIFAGTNDIHLGAASGAATYAFFQTYIEARLAARWNPGDIVVCTMLPRQGTHETERTAFNGALVTGAGTYGYKLARFDSDSSIGDAGDENDTNFYADTIHPITAGHAIMGGLVGAALLS